MLNDNLVGQNLKSMGYGRLCAASTKAVGYERFHCTYIPCYKLVAFFLVHRFFFMHPDLRRLPFPPSMLSYYSTFFIYIDCNKL